MTNNLIRRSRWSHLRLCLAVIAGLVLAGQGSGRVAVLAQSGGCASPANAIVAENCQAGNTDWDLTANDPTIQGFATQISVNLGETVSFKIDTDATAYTIEIYRLGYYGGAGARKITATNMALSVPQVQPACLNDVATGLIDCGNWAASATWDTTGQTSGIYLAKLTRTDALAAGASHIVFVVRDDARPSALVFQTSDTTWQAYNRYGGNSLYLGGPATSPSYYAAPGRAYKVSYNRPFDVRANNPGSWLFNAEYPMVRWLEANGYDVSYLTGVDTDRSAALIENHQAFLSVGHDEYWSGTQRANVEAARDAGVHLAFFSGNEMFWKTRWEESIDGTHTPRRTLVSYKESLNNAKIDPDAQWTGTWRDPAFSPPSDGGRPENGLSGTLWTVNCCSYSLNVPAEMGRQRFWRNTPIAAQPAGGTAMLTATSQLLGYEWDEVADNGFQPAGLTRLSSTTVDVPERLVDNAALTAPGTATHSLTLYRSHTVDSLGNPRSALVFGAGTVQWSWGLDGNHDRGASTPDPILQQATVNLLADMGAQPASIQPGLSTASASTDVTAPTATIVFPAAGATVESGIRVTVSGTAADVGGVVGGVELSLDGGATWHPAKGQANWTYDWTPGTTGGTTIQSRATDDSGNVGAPSAIAVTIGASPCPCTSLWNHDVTVPATVDGGDASAVEVGVKFSSDIDGFITGVRFYKSSLNTGTHVGHLWSSTGTLLATATFTGESSVGWQQVRFGAPVPILAHTTYVASYHTNVGHYSADQPYFALGAVNSPPLHAPADGNGLFTYGLNAFPTTTFRASNYWVDVDFAESVIDTTDLVISHINAAAIDGTRAVITWTTNKLADSRVDYSTNPTLAPAETVSATDGAFVIDHRITLTGLIPNSTYYFRLTSVDMSGNAAVTLAPNFTVPGPTLHDTASIDFLAGTPGAGISVSETNDGEVILAPAAGVEFSGSSLPPGWLGGLWQPGGSFSLADGNLLVDGARVGTCDAAAVPDCESGIYGPGHSLEFVATFSGDPYQHAGLGIKFEDQSRRAVFTTDAGGSFKTRTIDDGGASIVTDLGTAYLGFPHRFRIDWTATAVNFSVDGALVATHPAVIAGLMRPIAASDYNPFGGNVVVDWMRMSPYAASGTFVSRVFDAQGPVDWASIFWTGDTPPGTSLAVSVRTGDTATPPADGSVAVNGWSAFTPGSIPGDFPAASSPTRYVQYSVALTTNDPTITPQLHDIIISTDHAPVAVDDAATTATNTPYTFATAGATSLNANDSDVDSPFSQLKVISVSAAANGAATLNSNGSVTYTPLAGFTGTDGFTYTISDGLLASIANVTMMVGGPPTANADGVTVNENSGVNTLSVLANDAQIASGALIITSVTQGAHGAVAIVSGGTAVTYTPNANFFGADSFTYTITDSLGGTASAAVDVTVVNVNRAPSLAAIGSKSVAENALLALTLSATDPDGDPVTYSATGLPSGATLDASTGAFSWTPSFSQAGGYPVTFTASDNGTPALSASEAITITVTNANRAPVLTPLGNKSGDVGALLTFTVSATDPDGDVLTYGTTVLPAGATFDAVTGTFSWTPTSGQGGNYPITFTASDNGSPALSASEAITMLITSDQTITFAALDNKTFGDADFPVSATATSLLPVSFAGSGSCTVTVALVHLTGAGSCTITASQGGNTFFHAASPVSRTFSIGQVIGTIVVTSSNTPSLFGVPITLTATVTPGATGTVTFNDGATPLGLPIGLVGGVATLTTSTLAVGTHSITAIYSGSANYLGGTSPVSSQVISPSATLKVVFKVHAILDNTKHPKVRDFVVPGALVRVYSEGDPCASHLKVSDVPRKWGVIFDGADGTTGPLPGCPVVTVGSYRAEATTDAYGEATIIVPPTNTNPNQDWIIIGRTMNFDYINTPPPVDPLYSQDEVANIKANQTKRVSLHQIAPFGGGIIGARKIVELGTELDILEPEDYDWTDDTAQYPFVLVANGTWDVATSIAPPSGFVPDVSTLATTAQDGTTTAMQFTLTDVGGDWTQTDVTHVINHKGTTRIRTDVVRMFNRKKTKAKPDFTTVLPNSGANAIDVLANDNVAPPKTLTITGVTQGSNGSVTFTSTGVVYTPIRNVTGADTFTYSIDDGNGGVDTGTVHVRVNTRPSLVIGDASVAEGNSGETQMTFTVQLSFAIEGDVTFDYTTVDDTAVAGTDFALTHGTLVIPAGQASATITVPVIANTVDQPNRNFAVKLSKVINKAAAILGGTGKGVIVDDDPKPVISVSNVSVVEGNSGLTPATVTVTLTGATLLPVTVDFQTADGTAVAGKDYAAASGTLTFAPGTLAGSVYTPGDTVKTVTVQVVGDTVAEPTDSFFVAFGNATSATLATGKTPVTIIDDDSTTWTDTSVADLTAGTVDAGAYISRTKNGEVILAPAIGAEFSGNSSLPAGWTSTPLAAGGTSTFGGGGVTVDGAALLGGAGASYAAGRSIEFSASFSGAAGQYAGFAAAGSLTQPFAMFGTNVAGTLLARSFVSGTPVETAIAGNMFNGAHKFRIDWNATTVVYWVDDKKVATHTISIAATMQPAAVDTTVGAGALQVSYMRMTPYASAGTYLSGAYDAGTPVTWQVASWVADLPAGTSLAVEVRTGTTATPDPANWTPFQAITSGATVGGTSRYAQYRVTLSTTQANATPALNQLVITFTR